MDWLGAAERDAILLSLQVASVALACLLPVAVMLGWILARWKSEARVVLDVIVHLPLVMPPVVTGFLLLLAFGRKGPIGAVLDQVFGLVFAFRWTGAALAAAVMALPLVVRPIRLAFEAADPRLTEAASSLGVPPWRSFLTITLPLALPGILAGMILGFAKCLGEFGATVTFVSNIPGETRTLSLAIQTLLSAPGGDGPALRLALVGIVIAVAALILAEIVTRIMRRRLGLDLPRSRRSRGPA
ncbi:molybdenum ABC transporter permease [Tistrella mobilis]|uniref:Molybdenum transport system permease n=1 Tax=Tistrella mobilis TaxID=171437 RepID=A0A162LQM5_9PROT|nr:molybdate ABC transporter permease subunit [Tistrella mobilis]KYO56310.1 molybdenum ABC transporter permease [Tistrella mobilis]